MQSRRGLIPFSSVEGTIQELIEAVMHEFLLIYNILYIKSTRYLPNIWPAAVKTA
jgi:hypothetical protein